MLLVINSILVYRSVNPYLIYAPDERRAEVLKGMKGSAAGQRGSGAEGRKKAASRGAEGLRG